MEVSLLCGWRSYSLHCCASKFACVPNSRISHRGGIQVTTSERFNWDPLSVSPGFPLITCGNDGVRTPRLCGHADSPRLHCVSAAPGHGVVRVARLSDALFASPAAMPTGNSLPQ